MRARDVGPLVQSLKHLRNIEMDRAADPEALLVERRQQRLPASDRVLLGADPLADITNTRSVEAVVSKGRAADPGGARRPGAVMQGGDPIAISKPLQVKQRILMHSSNVR